MMPEPLTDKPLSLLTLSVPPLFIVPLLDRLAVTKFKSVLPNMVSLLLMLPLLPLAVMVGAIPLKLCPPFVKLMLPFVPVSDSVAEVPPLMVPPPDIAKLEPLTDRAPVVLKMPELVRLLTVAVKLAKFMLAPVTRFNVLACTLTVEVESEPDIL